VEREGPGAEGGNRRIRCPARGHSVAQGGELGQGPVFFVAPEAL